MVGILDQKTSQQLQMDSILTVEKAKKAIQQREALQEQTSALCFTKVTLTGAKPWT